MVRIDLAQSGATNSVFNTTTLAISVAALIVGVLAALYGRRALSPPRRQLEVVVNQVSPILTTTHDKFSVSYDGRPISSPHVCSLRIQSTGKFSISSAQFDNSKPIEIDLGVPIVETLNVETTPAESSLPEFAAAGTKLQILPSVLARGQIVDVSILTNGLPAPKISHHLIDTGVDFAVDRRQVQKLQGGRIDRAGQLSRIAIGAAAIAFATTALVLVVAFFDSGTPGVDQISLSGEEADFSLYYPPDGVVSSGGGPSRYSTDNTSVDQCQSWSSWARSEGAVPVNNRLTVSASTYSNVTVNIVKITPRVYGTFNLSGTNRLRCSTLIRADSNPDYVVDLSKPNASTNSATRLLLSNSDSMSIELRGTDGVGYEYGLEVEYSVDGKSKMTIIRGSSSSPLRTVLQSWKEGLQLFDWDESGSKWIMVS